MGVYKAANNAISTLVSISSNTLSVATAEGARFPEITGTDWTFISLEDDTNQIEVVKVTAHALAADVFTIVRAQKGTAEGSWAAGAVVEIRPHAEEFIEIYNHILDTADAHDASAISFVPAGGIAATDVQAALTELDTEKMPKTGGQFTGGVDITEGLTLDGAAGAVGQVPVSQGSGTPVWGASPASLGSTDTGTGSILAFSNATAAVNLIDLAAATNEVDYRIAHTNGTEYEVGSGTITYTGTGGRVWTEMFGDFDSAAIYGYIYNAGTYVVVGAGGKVLTSTDNINWTLRDGGFGSSDVYDVIYAGGQFVAVGVAGKLATSADGIVWTQRASAATAMASNAINKIAHDGGSLYVIAGAGGYIASSTDGITWTNRKSTGSILRGVAHGNGYFAAGGDSGSLFVSTDGTTWNTRTSGFAANAINDIAYGNVSGTTPTFVAVGDSGTVTFSTDGTFTTWSAATSGFSATNITSVIFASSKFVAVGWTGKISYDADGQGTWTAVTPLVTTQSKACIGYGNNTFLVGYGQGLGETSADGVTWLQKGLALNLDYVIGLMSNGSTTVVAGLNGYISSSTDLQAWTQRSSGSANIRCAIYGEKFVVAGASGGVSTSADGATWTYYASAIGSDAYALAYGNGVYVLAGLSGLLSTSATALTGSWTTRTSGFGSTHIYGACYGLVNGVTHTFVAVGSSGVISSSTDGAAATWTARTSGTSTQFEDVAFGNGRFVAVGQSGVVATSLDSITWALSTPLAVTVNAITFSNGLFVAGGTTGRLFTSPDGITWIEQTTDHVGIVYALATIGSSYYAGRASGVISSSPVGVPALSLTRAPYFSSNANALVGFTAGTKNVELIPNERNLNALTTTTTGTGDLTLASVRGSGALFANNGRASTVAYRILQGDQWEAGIGTLTNTGGMQQILSSAAGITVQSVLWDGTKFMAYGPTQTYAYSYDGIVWTTGSLTYSAGGYTGNKLGACYVNGLYILQDSAAGCFYTSTDGISWTQRTNNGANQITIEVAYGNGVYIAIHVANNSALYSTNGGVNWTASNPGTAAYGITFGAGTFLLTTNSSTYYTSINGVAWASRTLPGSGRVVRYLNGLFVTADTNLCYTSPDGINWTSRTITVTDPDTLVYGGGILLALGATNSTVAYSYDGGITWGSVALAVTPSAYNYYTCAYGKGRFLTAKNTTQPTIITPAISAYTLRRGCQASSEVSNAVLSLAAGTKTVNLAPYVSPDADTAAIYTKQTAWVPAGAMLSRTTNGAAAGTTELATNKVMVSTLDFDTTTQEFAQFSVAMPKSWIEGAISAQVVWSHAATTTNFGVAWEIQAVAISDDDALDAAFSTAVAVTDTGGTTNDLYTTIETLVPVNGTPQPLDTVIFQIARAPANAGDTMAIDARLHGVRLYYYTDSVSDA